MFRPTSQNFPSSNSTVQPHYSSSSSSSSLFSQFTSRFTSNSRSLSALQFSRSERTLASLWERHSIVSSSKSRSSSSSLSPSVGDDEKSIIAIANWLESFARFDHTDLADVTGHPTDVIHYSIITFLSFIMVRTSPDNLVRADDFLLSGGKEAFSVEVSLTSLGPNILTASTPPPLTAKNAALSAYDALNSAKETSSKATIQASESLAASLNAPGDIQLSSFAAAAATAAATAAASLTTAESAYISAQAIADEATLAFSLGPRDRHFLAMLIGITKLVGWQHNREMVMELFGGGGNLQRLLGSVLLTFITKLDSVLGMWDVAAESAENWSRAKAAEEVAAKKVRTTLNAYIQSYNTSNNENLLNSQEIMQAQASVISAMASWRLASKVVEEGRNSVLSIVSDPMIVKMTQFLLSVILHLSEFISIISGPSSTEDNSLSSTLSVILTISNYELSVSQRDEILAQSRRIFNNQAAGVSFNITKRFGIDLLPSTNHFTSKLKPNISIDQSMSSPGSRGKSRDKPQTRQKSDSVPVIIPILLTSLKKCTDLAFLIGKILPVDIIIGDESHRSWVATDEKLKNDCLYQEVENSMELFLKAEDAAVKLVGDTQTSMTNHILMTQCSLITSQSRLLNVFPSVSLPLLVNLRAWEQMNQLLVREFRHHSCHVSTRQLIIARVLLITRFHSLAQKITSSPQLMSCMLSANATGAEAGSFIIDRLQTWFLQWMKSVSSELPHFILKYAGSELISSPVAMATLEASCKKVLMEERFPTTASVKLPTTDLYPWNMVTTPDSENIKGSSIPITPAAFLSNVLNFAPADSVSLNSTAGSYWHVAEETAASVAKTGDVSSLFKPSSSFLAHLIADITTGFVPLHDSEYLLTQSVNQEQAISDPLRAILALPSMRLLTLVNEIMISTIWSGTSSEIPSTSNNTSGFSSMGSLCFEYILGFMTEARSESGQTLVGQGVSVLLMTFLHRSLSLGGDAVVAVTRSLGFWKVWLSFISNGGGSVGLLFDSPGLSSVYNLDSALNLYINSSVEGSELHLRLSDSSSLPLDNDIDNKYLLQCVKARLLMIDAVFDLLWTFTVRQVLVSTGSININDNSTPSKDLPAKETPAEVDDLDWNLLDSLASRSHSHVTITMAFRFLARLSVVYRRQSVPPELWSGVLRRGLSLLSCLTVHASKSSVAIKTFGSSSPPTSPLHGTELKFFDIDSPIQSSKQNVNNCSHVDFRRPIIHSSTTHTPSAAAAASEALINSSCHLVWPAQLAIMHTLCLVCYSESLLNWRFSGPGALTGAVNVTPIDTSTNDIVDIRWRPPMHSILFALLQDDSCRPFSVIILLRLFSEALRPLPSSVSSVDNATNRKVGNSHPQKSSNDVELSDLAVRNALVHDILATTLKLLRSNPNIRGGDSMAVTQNFITSAQTAACTLLNGLTCLLRYPTAFSGECIDKSTSVNSGYGVICDTSSTAKWKAGGQSGGSLNLSVLQGALFSFGPSHTAHKTVFGWRAPWPSLLQAVLTSLHIAVESLAASTPNNLWDYTTPPNLDQELDLTIPPDLLAAQSHVVAVGLAFLTAAVSGSESAQEHFRRCLISRRRLELVPGSTPTATPSTYLSPKTKFETNTPVIFDTIDDNGANAGDVSEEFLIDMLSVLPLDGHPPVLLASLFEMMFDGLTASSAAHFCCLLDGGANSCKCASGSTESGVCDVCGYPAKNVVLQDETCLSCKGNGCDSCNGVGSKDNVFCDGVPILRNPHALSVLLPVLQCWPAPVVIRILRVVMALFTDPNVASVNLSTAAVVQPSCLATVIDVYAAAKDRGVRRLCARLLRTIGAHSVTVAELKRIIRVLAPTSFASQSCGGLITSVDNMVTGDEWDLVTALRGTVSAAEEPRYFLLLSGPASGVYITPALKWPAHSSYTITLWFSPHIGSMTASRRQVLFSVRQPSTDAGLELYLMPAGNEKVAGASVNSDATGTAFLLYADVWVGHGGSSSGSTSGSHRQRVTEKLIGFRSGGTNGRAWHCLAFSHTRGRLFAKSTLLLSLDGVEVRSELQFPRFVDGTPIFMSVGCTHHAVALTTPTTSSDNQKSQKTSVPVAANVVANGGIVGASPNAVDSSDHGHDVFNGRIASLHVFSDALTTTSLAEIYSLGVRASAELSAFSSVMTVTTVDGTSGEFATDKESTIATAASSLVLALNPGVHSTRTLLDQADATGRWGPSNVILTESPKVRNSQPSASHVVSIVPAPGRSMEGRLLRGTLICSPQDARHALSSLGGVKVLFPALHIAATSIATAAVDHVETSTGHISYANNSNVLTDVIALIVGATVRSVENRDFMLREGLITFVATLNAAAKCSPLAASSVLSVSVATAVVELAGIFGDNDAEWVEAVVSLVLTDFSMWSRAPYASQEIILRAAIDWAPSVANKLVSGSGNGAIESVDCGNVTTWIVALSLHFCRDAGQRLGTIFPSESSANFSRVSLSAVELAAIRSTVCSLIRMVVTQSSESINEEIVALLRYCISETVVSYRLDCLRLLLSLLTPDRKSAPLILSALCSCDALLLLSPLTSDVDPSIAAYSWLCIAAVSHFIFHVSSTYLSSSSVGVVDDVSARAALEKYWKSLGVKPVSIGAWLQELVVRTLSTSLHKAVELGRGELLCSIMFRVLHLAMFGASVRALAPDAELLRIDGNGRDEHGESLEYVGDDIHSAASDWEAGYDWLYEAPRRICIAAAFPAVTEVLCSSALTNRTRGKLVSRLAQSIAGRENVEKLLALPVWQANLLTVLEAAYACGVVEATSSATGSGTAAGPVLAVQSLIGDIFGRLHASALMFGELVPLPPRLEPPGSISVESALDISTRDLFDMWKRDGRRLGSTSVRTTIEILRAFIAAGRLAWSEAGIALLASIISMLASSVSELKNSNAIPDVERAMRLRIIEIASWLIADAAAELVSVPPATRISENANSGGFFSSSNTPTVTSLHNLNSVNEKAKSSYMNEKLLRNSITAFGSLVRTASWASTGSNGIRTSSRDSSFSDPMEESELSDNYVEPDFSLPADEVVSSVSPLTITNTDISRSGVRSPRSLEKNVKDIIQNDDAAVNATAWSLLSAMMRLLTEAASSGGNTWDRTDRWTRLGGGLQVGILRGRYVLALVSESVDFTLGSIPGGSTNTSNVDHPVSGGWSGRNSRDWADEDENVGDEDEDFGGDTKNLLHRVQRHTGWLLLRAMLSFALPPQSQARSTHTSDNTAKVSLAPDEVICMGGVSGGYVTPSSRVEAIGAVSWLLTSMVGISETLIGEESLFVLAAISASYGAQPTVQTATLTLTLKLAVEILSTHRRLLLKTINSCQPKAQSTIPLWASAGSGGVQWSGPAANPSLPRSSSLQRLRSSISALVTNNNTSVQRTDSSNSSLEDTLGIRKVSGGSDSSDGWRLDSISSANGDEAEDEDIRGWHRRDSLPATIDPDYEFDSELPTPVSGSQVSVAAFLLSQLRCDKSSKTNLDAITWPNWKRWQRRALKHASSRESRGIGRRLDGVGRHRGGEAAADAIDVAWRSFSNARRMYSSRVDSTVTSALTTSQEFVRRVAISIADEHTAAYSQAALLLESLYQERGPWGSVSTHSANTNSVSMVIGCSEPVGLRVPRILVPSNVLSYTQFLKQAPPKVTENSSEQTSACNIIYEVHEGSNSIDESGSEIDDSIVLYFDDDAVDLLSFGMGDTQTNSQSRCRLNSAVELAALAAKLQRFRSDTAGNNDNSLTRITSGSLIGITETNSQDIIYEDADIDEKLVADEIAATEIAERAIEVTNNTTVSITPTGVSNHFPSTNLQTPPLMRRRRRARDDAVKVSEAALTRAPCELVCISSVASSFPPPPLGLLEVTRQRLVFTPYPLTPEGLTATSATELVSTDYAPQSKSFNIGGWRSGGTWMGGSDTSAVFMTASENAEMFDACAFPFRLIHGAPPKAIIIWWMSDILTATPRAMRSGGVALEIRTVRRQTFLLRFPTVAAARAVHATIHAVRPPSLRQLVAPFGASPAAVLARTLAPGTGGGAIAGSACHATTSFALSPSTLATSGSNTNGGWLGGGCLNVTTAWVNREISNFEYLMALNNAAGRSTADLAAYPIMPWVIADYESPSLDLTSKATFRDLRWPVGAQREEQRMILQERYEDLRAAYEEDCGDCGALPPFHHGTHYSVPGVVIWWLMRLEPYTSLHVRLQDGHFDRKDRLLHSLAGAWSGCVTNAADGKELIPELFSVPETLLDLNHVNIAARGDGNGGFSPDCPNVPLGDVQLPPWASSAYEFIRLHRLALESEEVSLNLHHWIDLIFGASQRPPHLSGGSEAAVKAANVFFHLTYDGAVDLAALSENNPALAAQATSQIAEFGQTPPQLFTRHHPSRRPLHTSENVRWPIASVLLGAHTALKNTEDNDSDDGKSSTDLVLPGRLLCWCRHQVAIAPLLFLTETEGSILVADASRTISTHSFSITSSGPIPFRLRPDTSSMTSVGSRTSSRGSGRRYFGVPFAAPPIRVTTARFDSLDSIVSQSEIASTTLPFRPLDATVYALYESSLTSCVPTSMSPIPVNLTPRQTKSTRRNSLFTSHRLSLELPANKSSINSAVMASMTTEVSSPHLSASSFAWLPEFSALLSCGHWDWTVRATALDSSGMSGGAAASTTPTPGLVMGANGTTAPGNQNAGSAGRTVATLAGHRDVATCLALARDAECYWLATGGRDCRVAIWKLTSAYGTLASAGGNSSALTVEWIRTLNGHDEAVTSLAIAIELDCLLSGGADGQLLFHSLTDGRFLRCVTNGVPAQLSSQSSPQCEPINCSVWGNENTNSTETAACSDRNTPMLSRCGSMLDLLDENEHVLHDATISITGNPYRRSAEPHSQTNSTERGWPVSWVGISGIGYIIVYSATEKMLSSFSLGTGVLLATRRLPESLHALTLSADGRVLVTGGTAGLVVMRWVHSLALANDESRYDIPAIVDGSGVSSESLDADIDESVPSASHTPGTTNSWRWGNRRTDISTSVRCFSSPIRSLLLTRDERCLVVGEESGELSILAFDPTTASPAVTHRRR